MYKKAKKVLDTGSKVIVQSMGVNMDWTEERETGKKMLKKAKGVVGKVIDGIEGRSKKRQDTKRAKNEKMMDENWGGVENYMQLQEAEDKLKAQKKIKRK